MRETIELEGNSMNEGEYKELMAILSSKGYQFKIDPRDFDTPLTIAARFESRDKDIRFVELSPNLELSIEHTTTKTKAKVKLKKIKDDFQKTLKVGDVKMEDYELATLQTMASQTAVLEPKNNADRKLFKSLETKGIFSKMLSMDCPKCNRSFLLPSKNLNLVDKRVFCKECERWFKIENSKELYVLNEEYMKAMGGMWDKFQQLMKSNWRELVKRGIAKIPPPP